MSDECIVEAGTILVGLGDDGEPSLRYGAAARIDGGVIAHVGAIEAVVCANEHLPRHGGPELVILPLYLIEAGGLKSGMRADLALIDRRATERPQPSLRAAISEAARGRHLGLRKVFVSGKLVLDERGIVADGPALSEFEAYLNRPDAPPEKTLWEAALRLLEDGAE